MSSNSDTSAGGRIYYQGPDIVVTSLYIQTLEDRYRINDLNVEGPRYFNAYPARVLALYCGIVGLLLAAGAALLYGSAELLLCTVGLVASIGLASAIWIDERRNPRWMELAAWHRGRRVILFASNDKRVFGQVQRAVVRALEANRRPQP